MLDNAKLTEIIQSATREMTQRTEAFVQSVEGRPAGEATVTVMVNGKETVLSQQDYAELKAQTQEVKLRRKAEIKALVGQLKERRNAETQELE